MANKPKFTPTEMVRIVRESDGTVVGIAETAGVTEETVRNYRKRSKKVAAAMEETAWLRQEERRVKRQDRKDEMYEMAQENLQLKLLDRDWNATRFTLETLGKDDGFSKRTELTGTLGVLELSAEALEALRTLGIEPSAAVEQFEALVRAEAAAMADSRKDE